MEKNMYKETLLKFAENDFEDMKIDAKSYIPLALRHIGDIDPELRDDLNYPFLATLIGDELISDSQIIDLLNELTSESYLFYNISNEKSDDIFKRTFSILILAVIAAENIDRDFLSKDDINKLSESIKKYMHMENDFRGFLDSKGWAHSVAHIADVINFLTYNKNHSFTQGMDLLYSHRDMYMRSKEAFTHNEDERIVTAIASISKRDDFEKVPFIEFIKSIDKSNYTDVYTCDMYLKMNSKALLRSLYFRLLKDEKRNDLCDVVLEQLEIFS